MISSAVLAAILTGLAGGTGSAWLLLRRERRSTYVWCTRENTRLKKDIISNIEEQAKRGEEALLQELEDFIKQQVAEEMSRVLQDIAQAEQQRAQLAQAQADAEELNRLRAYVQRAQAANAQQESTAQVSEAIAQMNSRMAAMAERMRQAGVNPGVQ